MSCSPAETVKVQLRILRLRHELHVITSKACSHAGLLFLYGSYFWLGRFIPSLAFGGIISDALLNMREKIVHTIKPLLTALALLIFVTVRAYAAPMSCSRDENEEVAI